MRIRRGIAMLAMATTMMAGSIVAAPAASAAYGPCSSSTSIYLSYTHRLVAPARSGSTHCYLVQGHQGNGVKALQRALNCSTPYTIAVDGVFGSNTKAKLRYFQSRNGLAVDGVYGPNTRDKLKFAVTDRGSYNGSCGRI